MFDKILKEKILFFKKMNTCNHKETMIRKYVINLAISLSGRKLK